MLCWISKQSSIYRWEKLVFLPDLMVLHLPNQLEPNDNVPPEALGRWALNASSQHGCPVFSCFFCSIHLMFGSLCTSHNSLSQINGREPMPESEMTGPSCADFATLDSTNKCMLVHSDVTTSIYTRWALIAKRRINGARHAADRGGFGQEGQ